MVDPAARPPLKACYRCGRIVVRLELDRGSCRDRADCAAAAMIARGKDDPEFVRGIERGLEATKKRQESTDDDQKPTRHERRIIHDVSRGHGN